MLLAELEWQLEHTKSLLAIERSALAREAKRMRKVEHDRDRYAAKIESLRAENAELRAKYADNWHDPPQVGDHKWVKMVFRGKGLPLQQEGGGDDE